MNTARVFKTTKGTERPIMNMKGKEYLEVKYRLVWFREDHPTWGIETEFTAYGDKHATARAVVRDDAGRIMATAHKSETAAGFADFAEKAETGAIGRALALIGYGTQFCADDLDEGARIVDSPTAPPGSATTTGREQPTDEDNGMPGADTVYTVPFGKFRAKTLEQVYSSPVRGFGPDGIKGYITWLESEAKKKNEPLTAKAVEFIREAEAFLGAMENGGAQ